MRPVKEMTRTILLAGAALAMASLPLLGAASQAVAADAGNPYNVAPK